MRDEQEEKPLLLDTPAKPLSLIRVVNVSGLRGEARKGVVYVGRGFAGWMAHPLGNPFRPQAGDLPGTCLTLYAEWLSRKKNLDELMRKLWIQTQLGALPLGCWCTDATAGDGSPIICHAQILADMLRDRFVVTTG